MLRRVHSEVKQVLTCGDISLNTTTQRLTINERPVALSQTLFSLLAAFMRHPNQVLTRDQLISLALNNDFDGFDRAIDNHILRLRKQLESAGHQPIQTVYGAGYRFVVED